MKRERAMRKAAERGDQDKSTEGTYIDPYAGSSPSVNDELKQWLSPAAQRKRLMGRIPKRLDARLVLLARSSSTHPSSSTHLFP